MVVELTERTSRGVRRKFNKHLAIMELAFIMVRTILIIINSTSLLIVYAVTLLAVRIT